MDDQFKLSDLSPYFEGLFLAQTLQDWNQTKRALKDPRHEEGNPILGPHPHQDKMTGFGTLMDLAQYAGYKALPDNWKLPYTALSSLVEGANVLNNEKLTHYGWDAPLLGLGALITGALVDDYNKSHKKSKMEPYATVSDKGTPMAGMTLRY